MAERRLEGRFALITGGSRGIGRAVAEHFAREGATVAVNYVHARDEADEVIAAIGMDGDDGRDHCAIGGDVGSPDAFGGMIDDLVARWGRLDILVNNAGIQSPTPGNATETETLERIVRVNLLGAAHGSRAAIRHFLSRPGGGTIINTSSVHEMIPKPGYLAYSMSKGGMGNLTKTLALEFADRDIRVNAVAPGAVLTDINDAWRNDPKARAAVESHIPMGFAATPDDVAPVFVFLASEASRYVTGQTIYACGGLTLYGEFKQNWSS